MKSLYYQHSHAKHAKNFTTIDILMFPSLRKIAIPLLFLNFLYVYLFYAPTFISKESEDNVFQNGIISGLSSLFSVPFCWLLLEKF